MNDLINECMSDLKTTDMAAFTMTFCERCRQPGCHRAKWAGDKFGARVATQFDRLLRPEQADPTSSRYEHLVDFQNMMQEAMRLEISDRRGDWEIPGDIKEVTSRVQVPRHMLYQEPEEDVLEPPKAVPLPPQAPEGIPATVAPVSKMGAAQIQPGAPRNTPQAPAGGIMIGGATPPAKAPVMDPWAVKSTVQVVKPGATIKMGK
jgi:hypothetical protein